MRACFPPDDLALDGIELGKGALDTFRCCERCIDILRRYAVGQKREFEIGRGVLPKATLAGKVGKIEEIGKPRRRLFQLVLIVGEDRRIDDCPHAAIRCGAGEPVRLRADLFPVDRLEKTFVTALEQGRRVDVHHINRRVAAVDHCLDLGNFAAVLLLGYLSAGLLGVGAEYGLSLGVLIGATEAHDGKRLGREGHAERQARNICVLNIGIPLWRQIRSTRRDARLACGL